MDERYRQGSEVWFVDGEEIALPRRLHFNGLQPRHVAPLPVTAQCLISRATDGYLRQAATRCLLTTAEP